MFAVCVCVCAGWEGDRRLSAGIHRHTAMVTLLKNPTTFGPKQHNFIILTVTVLVYSCSCISCYCFVLAFKEADYNENAIYS